MGVSSQGISLLDFRNSSGRFKILSARLMRSIRHVGHVADLILGFLDVDGFAIGQQNLGMPGLPLVTMFDEDDVANADGDFSA